MILLGHQWSPNDDCLKPLVGVGGVFSRIWDLSFRVVFSRICGVPSRIGGVSSGFEGKISIGALDIFNGGVKNPMVVLKRGNGGIEKIRRGYCVGSMGGTGGMEKGSMVALKRVNGALVRVSAGIGQGQWGYWKGSMGVGQGQWHWSGSMGALVRVNGGIEKGQWRRWSGSMGALGSMGVGQGQWGYGTMGAQWRYWQGLMVALVRLNEVLKRVNGGVGQGQWGHGEVALGQTGVWLGVAVGQTGGL